MNQGERTGNPPLYTTNGNFLKSSFKDENKES